MAEGELSVDQVDKKVAYVVSRDERIEGLEERGERSTKGRGEGGDEVPSRSDKHRVVFRGFFGQFISFVLVRVLLADGLLFEDSGSQCADVGYLWKVVSVHERSRRSLDSLVSINAGPILLRVSARATQSAEATFLSGFRKHRVKK